MTYNFPHLIIISEGYHGVKEMGMADLKSVSHIEVYWTTKEVAERLRKSPDAVKKWLSSGALKRTKAGGSTLISETNLQAFLKESTERSAA